MSNTRVSPGDHARPGMVVDIEGKSVNLADLWAEGPTLLTFLRHFG